MIQEQAMSVAVQSPAWMRLAPPWPRRARRRGDWQLASRGMPAAIPLQAPFRTSVAEGQPELTTLSARHSQT